MWLHYSLTTTNWSALLTQAKTCSTCTTTRSSFEPINSQDGLLHIMCHTTANYLITLIMQWFTACQATHVQYILPLECQWSHVTCTCTCRLEYAANPQNYPIKDLWNYMYITCILLRLDGSNTCERLRQWTIYKLQQGSLNCMNNMTQCTCTCDAQCTCTCDAQCTCTCDAQCMCTLYMHSVRVHVMHSVRVHVMHSICVHYTCTVYVYIIHAQCMCTCHAQCTCTCDAQYTCTCDAQCTCTCDAQCMCTLYMHSVRVHVMHSVRVHYTCTVIHMNGISHY